MPFQKLQEIAPDKVEVKVVDNPLGMDKTTMKWIPDWDFADIKWADIVVISNISNFGGPYTARIAGKAKEFGKYVHFDTDDLLTNLYEEHHLHGVYRDKGLDNITKFIYAHSDLVTVTQKKFADRIRPFCTSLLGVIKNSIDYNLACWRLPKQPDSKVRVGWAGGIHHLPDVKVFAGIPSFVNQKVGRENVRWDMYGHPPPTPEGKDDWQFKTWQTYKHEFAKGMKGPKNITVNYALPTDKYGMMFTVMDISIAPLKMNPFNDSKSDIKVAEAGRYAIPLIASNIGCYDETIINGETGYLIDPDAPKSEWTRILTKVIKDKKHREEMGRNLKVITDELFDTNKVVYERYKMYEETFEQIGEDPRSKRNES
jgi:glycosyltransferase involved in cell wall biosynthesis